MDTLIKTDWRAWRGRHPHLFYVIVTAKRLRTKMGLAVAACIEVMAETMHVH
ncbi:MAG: hypothetical protein V2A79_13675 [Planctomycetota bacterium]